MSSYIVSSATLVASIITAQDSDAVLVWDARREDRSNTPDTVQVAVHGFDTEAESTVKENSANDSAVHEAKEEHASANRDVAGSVVFDEDELCSLLDVTTLLSADDDEVPVHTIDVLHHAPDSSINPLLPHIAHHPSLMDAFHPDTPEPEFEFETEIEIGCIDALNPRNVTPEKENQVQLQEEIPYSPAAATFNSLRSSNEFLNSPSEGVTNTYEIEHPSMPVTNILMANTGSNVSTSLVTPGTSAQGLGRGVNAVECEAEKESEKESEKEKGCERVTRREGGLAYSA